MEIWIVALGVFIFNLPFGYWRANVKKMSPQWFVAVHAPVLFSVGLRLIAGVSFDLSTFPIMIGAFSLGQFLGGRLHGWWRSRPRASVTSCLVWDVMKELFATPRLP